MKGRGCSDGGRSAITEHYHGMKTGKDQLTGVLGHQVGLAWWIEWHNHTVAMVCTPIVQLMAADTVDAGPGLRMWSQYGLAGDAEMCS